MANAAYQILKFFVSALVPYLVRFVEPNATVTMKAILGIGIFLGWSVIDLLRRVDQLSAAEERRAHVWTLRQEGEVTLHNIRKYYLDVVNQSYGENDLFLDHFHSRLHDLADVFRRATEQRELAVKDYHFQRTDLLLGAFDGDPSGILRYVWIATAGEVLFDDKWAHYCDQIVRGITNGRIKEVRVLIVLGKGVPRSGGSLDRLTAFYDCSKGHDYRLVDEAIYVGMRSDGHLETNFVDFGVYGTRYLYRTVSYDAGTTTGQFNKHPEVIDKYSKFFDNVWNSHSSTRAPKSKVRVKMADLLQLRW